ncbi:hypothetical protein MSSAC_0694 [Methanosarcina siciliae C2J]|uniref:Uncharacterized protein n=1 Tax=Methanosarcina siciliae C2J TaxID=1434118 RepID=A0A0E3PLH5_9EURY|nr:hypothetical protein MSSAC_0694 [Methanosarcina siciliae C2J]
MLHIPKEYETIRRAYFDISQYPAQPFIQSTRQIDPAPVQIPLNPEVDVGNDQSGFGVRDCEGGFFKDWGDFGGHNRRKIVFKDLKKLFFLKRELFLKLFLKREHNFSDPQQYVIYDI